MQCFSCGFNCMPGSRVCGRCGANLALTAAPIAVMPPRAGALAKRFLPGWWAFNRRVAPLLQRIGLREAATPVLALPLETVIRPLIAIVSRPSSLVPGLPFLLRPESRAAGTLILAAWLGSVLLALAFHGQPVLCLLLAGAALAIHAASTIQATGLDFRGVGARLAGIVTAALLVTGVLYVPATVGLTRIVGGAWTLVPVRVPVDIPPLSEGDIIWLDRAARARPGDLVVTSRPQTLRRIRALAGQEVAMVDGVLLVDGVPSPWQSASRPLAEGVRFTVPPHRCFVLLPEHHAPGEAPADTGDAARGDWPFANRRAVVREVVQQRDIGDWLPLVAAFEGRIVGRSYPVSRFGRVD